eukprot:CAMPEP_0117536374 /NCGR_PEP_ID=MMETSP0784-20121206/41420_1 /TAXON_ID=39447 /ORGANISM="" /LENGTH=338 /DNA_ID=CAMNT_0005332935 /DNA_START=25 /DNA_END=1040 /DNA_ORIENTATION=+
MVDRSEAARIERMCIELAESDAPPWAAKYLKKAAPAIGILWSGATVAGPLLFKLGAGIYGIYGALPRQAITGLWGVGLCFYGGRYVVTFAAIEAFQAAGGSAMIDSVKDIVEQINDVKEADDLDNKEDANKDGVPDVDQMSSKALVRRKMALALKTVDPQVLTNAVGCLWTGYMGVLASLKFKFAQTVAFAHSIGDSFRPIAGKLLAPSLLSVTPPEYRRWVNPLINFGCKVVAGYIAWKVQRTISTVHCGVKGGLVAARSAIALMRDRGWFNTPDDKTLVDEVGGYSIAACGIYYQLLRNGATSAIFHDSDVLARGPHRVVAPMVSHLDRWGCYVST